MMKLSTPIQTPTNKVVFLFGPTAVGKTDLLCSLFSSRFEVVNADSVQVYRGLDIGSAKADGKVQSVIKHHLIDIREPWQQFNVGDFVLEADKACDLIRQNGKYPVISGGTAYYFKNFLYGLPQTPKSDDATRAFVNRKIEEIGPEASYELLQRLDPQSALRIHPNDVYRISRALEVFYGTGKKLSECVVSNKSRNDMDVLVLGLTRPKECLDRRMAQRVETMFKEGLLEEVQRLIAQGANSSWAGMQGIGYKEFFDARRSGEFSIPLVKEAIVSNSRHYAKRQMTFFKSFSNVHWFNPDDKDRIDDLLAEFLSA